MKNPHFQTLSAKGYAHLCQIELEKFETDEGGYRGVCRCLAGTEARAREFLSPRGVGISRFAAMTGLPVTTVRHYLRLGLIEPFVVNGKFKFQMVNLMQAESVRQWVELGFSLEQITERKAEQKSARLLVQDILENVTNPDGGSDTSVVVMRRTVDERGWLDETSITRPSTPDTRDGEQPALNDLTRDTVRQLHDEYQRVVETLETKLGELHGRLEKTRDFVKRLGTATSGVSRSRISS
jgi:DNA-binding transcriptional MerR regulator